MSDKGDTSETEGRVQEEDILIQDEIFKSRMQASNDFFGSIPSDTDYKMFAKDYGDIPGLDIIFLLGGYFYHTSFEFAEIFFYMNNPRV